MTPATVAYRDKRRNGVAARRHGRGDWLLDLLRDDIVVKVDGNDGSMIMATSNRLRTTTRRSPAANGAAARPMITMFMVPGDPAAALRNLDLPAGAEVAIVSSRPETTEQIALSNPTFATVRRVYSDAGPSPVIDRQAFEPDARSRAIVEGVRIAQADLRAAGGAYDLDQVRCLLRGISRQAVAKKVRNGTLLAVPGPSNRQSFPTLQFNRDGSTVAGIGAVRAALPTCNPWTVLNFLANPDARLAGRKPIDLLRSGEIDAVVEAAKRLGEQGA